MIFRKGIILAALVWLAAMPPAHAAYGEAQLLFRIRSNSLTESSGIARSTLDPNTYWTHNDSPDPGLKNLGAFVALDQTGLIKTTFNLRGSTNVDWEDMSQGATSSGEPALFFADFGDNYEARPFGVIYEVKEPNEFNSAAVDLVPEAAHVIVYEDGPHNAESFMVDPADGSFVVVTKDSDGQSGIYVSDPVALEGQPRLMRRVADLNINSIASGSASSYKSTTGADVAPDRSRFVVRTYMEAFEWELGTKSFAQAVSAAPLVIALPPTQQGEAIAYTPDGNDLITSTEGIAGPVYLLPGV